MHLHLTGPPRLKQGGRRMIPDSPSELIKNHTEDRAREFFDAFDEFSPAMQQQAQLLMRVGIDQGLSDVVFREMITIALAFWRDCNHARFHENNATGEMRECFRSAQLDQFLNTSITALNGLPQLTNDLFITDEEPDGS